MIVYDPTGAVDETIDPAQGLTLPLRKDVERLGILDNGKHNAGLLLSRTAEHIQTALGDLEVIQQRKANPGSAAHVEDLRKLATCQVVLTGSGD